MLRTIILLLAMGWGKVFGTVETTAGILYYNLNTPAVVLKKRFWG
jgi:hypothetical protein